MDHVDSTGLGFQSVSTPDTAKKSKDPNNLATADMSTLLTSMVLPGEDPITSAAEIQDLTYDPTATADPYSAVNNVRSDVPDVKPADIQKMKTANPFFDANYSGRVSRFYQPGEPPATQDPYNQHKTHP